MFGKVKIPQKEVSIHCCPFLEYTNCFVYIIQSFHSSISNVHSWGLNAVGYNWREMYRHSSAVVGAVELTESSVSSNRLCIEEVSDCL